MKTKKMIPTVFAALLLIVISFTSSKTFAQTKSDSTKNKDYIMMKSGKMMHTKDGKTMPMAKEMTFKNGTRCMTNGDYEMSDGKKMKMKEGECMDMNGMMGTCGMMGKENKNPKTKIGKMK
ncbi:MAG: DUF6799 domain-containing protein [Bacteroidia bacterium]